MTKDKILVTGANGFLGSSLIEYLSQYDWDVTAQVRPNSDLRWLLAKSELPLIRSPLQSVDEVSQWLNQFNIIIHAAGTTKATASSHFYEGNVNTTQTLCKALQSSNHGPRMIYISTQAVMGPSPYSNPKKDSDSPQPISHYGKAKLATENLLQQSIPRDKLTILRPSSIYGPRDTGFLKLFRLANRRWALIPRRSDNAVQLLYIDDFINAIVKVIANPTIKGSYVVTDPTPQRHRDIYDLLEAIFQKRMRRITIPKPVLFLAGQFAGLKARITGKADIFNPDKAREMGSSNWIGDPQPFMEMADWRPNMTIREGFTRTLFWYQQEGWI